MKSKRVCIKWNNNLDNTTNDLGASEGVWKAQAGYREQ